MPVRGAEEEDQKLVEILVVEDEEGDRLLISDYLRDCGIPVNLHVADNGLKAVIMLSQFTPDLVILDLALPEISDHEILRRYHRKGVPTIVFSDSRDPEEKNRVLRLGASDYVQKPFDLDEYNAAIIQMCRKWVFDQNSAGKLGV